MAKLLPHREDIIPIKSEAYVPPQIPREEAPASGPAMPPPMRARQREEAPPVNPPSDRHCSRCGQSTTFYYDLFQLKSAHVDLDAASRLNLEKHPWVMGVFCGQCRTYLTILPAMTRQAPTVPAFTHG